MISVGSDNGPGPGLDDNGLEQLVSVDIGGGWTRLLGFAMLLGGELSCDVATAVG